MDKDKKDSLIKELRKLVNDGIDLRRNMGDDEVKENIEQVVFSYSKEFYLNISEKKDLVESIFNSMRRLDIIQPVIDDPTVTEIMINGPDNIFIERDGKVKKLDIGFESRQKLEDVIQIIVSKVNRTVNEASPIVDARLSDGSRVNVVLPPIALNGPIVSIRKFPDKPMTIDTLIEYGSITEEVAIFLEKLVKAKYNIFISGGTGSGKTTFLNALSNFIPRDERIITIEDSAELNIAGLSNLVRLETRNSNTEGRGEITIKDLIKASLRMRPERIIVGEVRGPEALDMLQAMNTGHDGSLSTGHANSTNDMLSRLETMVLSGSQMPLEAIRQQIASALDIIIHLSRLRDKSRKTVEISEIAGYKNGQVILNPLYTFIDDGDTEERKVKGMLFRTQNQMQNTYKFKMAGISEKV